MENWLKFLPSGFCSTDCVWTSAAIQLQQSENSVVQGRIERFEMMLGRQNLTSQKTCSQTEDALPSFHHPSSMFFVNLNVKLGGSQNLEAKHCLLFGCLWCPRQAVILLYTWLSLWVQWKIKGVTFSHLHEKNHLGHTGYGFVALFHSYLCISLWLYRTQETAPNYLARSGW